MAKILVAEDEKDIRELVELTLKLAGHSVTSAANGEEAIKSAKKEHPDLILLDFRMPRMNGDEAAQKLKAMDEFTNTPIAFLTARDQDAEISGMIANGMEFINKPFSIDQLTRRVNEILQKHA
jgi:two-component system alkaline phosphatase synthesis response regulator PhoP